MNGSKVLVTGGAGFIGSHTADELLKRGYSVSILDNLQPRVHPRGKPDWLPQEAQFIQGDVTNRDDMKQALEGMDYVVHLAAYQDHLSDFSTFIHVNTESIALLFELIVERKLPVRKIVFASSQAVCGEGSYLCRAHGSVVPDPRPIEQLERGEWEIYCPHCGEPMEPQLIGETTANSGTAYGISKYAMELLANLLGHRYLIPTVGMRYSCVQGPRNSFYNAYSGIARIFALRVMHGLPPVCFEDGRQLRDYVNVLDVAKANALVLEDERANFQVYNVGGGTAVTVEEFAGIMIREFKSDLQPQLPGTFRLGDTRHTVSDISKLRSLGWEPTIKVEENVSQYVAWLKDQQVTLEYMLAAEKLMQEQGVILQGKGKSAGEAGRLA